MCSEASTEGKLPDLWTSRLTGATSWPITILPPEAGGSAAFGAAAGAVVATGLASAGLASAGLESAGLGEVGGCGVLPQATIIEAPKAPAVMASYLRAWRRLTEQAAVGMAAPSLAGWPAHSGGPRGSPKPDHGMPPLALEYFAPRGLSKIKCTVLIAQ